MKTIWVTEHDTVHHRKPEQVATEFVDAESANKRIRELLEANNSLVEECRKHRNEKLAAVQTSSALLKALVSATF